MREIITTSWFGVALLVGVAQAVPPDFLDTAEGARVRAIAAQDTDLAWDLLQPLRWQWEGDPGFDLLLATAAMERGAWSEAVLALERVEFIQPGAPGVRTQLMRARFEAERARAGSWGPPPAELEATDPDAEDRADLALLRRLASDGDWEAARREALLLLSDWEGDPEFDYLYGLAALEAGDAGEAVFALERALLLAPDRLMVRAQLARAHFLLGDLDRAEVEFRRVLAGVPPDSVRRSVEGYLEQIRVMGLRTQPSLHGEVKLALGFDSNVNAATGSALVDTPVGTFPLGSDGTAQETGYNQVAAQLLFDVPRSQRRRVDLTFAAGLRHNVSQPQFDIDVYRASVAHVWERDRSTFSLGVRGSNALVDDDQFQWTAGGIASWEYRASPWRLGATALLTAVRYPDDGLRDVDQLLLSTTAGYFFDDSVVTMEVYGARDEARRGGGGHHGRDFGGVSANLQMFWLDRHLPYLRLMYQHARHHDDDPVFDQRRRDQQATAVAGWSWFVTPELMTRAELSYTEVDSTIELFDFDRARIETALLYRF